MTRTALTLAASVTSAVPGALVTASAPLSTGELGRFDAALVRVAGADGERLLVVRASTDDLSAAELAAETLALRALTAGTRAQLPFAAPEVIAEAPLAQARLQVTDFVPGYRVQGDDVPPGPGAASSIGEALAAVHALPPSVVQAAGLPSRDAREVREGAAALLERALDTGGLPAALATRWGDAVGDEALWQFEPCVVLGEASASSFRFTDIDDRPTVTGVLGWHALAVGDPASDLHWTTSAPGAAETIFEAYAAASTRAPDPHLRTRARLFAELEFARWLVHGFELRRDDIVADAEALLASLVDGLGRAESLGHETEWADAEADADVPLPAHLVGEGDATFEGEAASAAAMQTDAYSPDEFAELSEVSEVSARGGGAALAGAAEAEGAAERDALGVEQHDAEGAVEDAGAEGAVADAVAQAPEEPQAPGGSMPPVQLTRASALARPREQALDDSAATAPLDDVSAVLRGAPDPQSWPVGTAAAGREEGRWPGEATAPIARGRLAAGGDAHAGDDSWERLGDARSTGEDAREGAQASRRDTGELWSDDDLAVAEEMREAERASRAAFHRWASADSESTSSPRITKPSDT